MRKLLSIMCAITMALGIGCSTDTKTQTSGDLQKTEQAWEYDWVEVDGNTNQYTNLAAWTLPNSSGNYIGNQIYLFGTSLTDGKMYMQVVDSGGQYQVANKAWTVMPGQTSSTLPNVLGTPSFTADTNHLWVYTVNSTTNYLQYTVLSRSGNYFVFDSPGVWTQMSDLGQMKSADVVGSSQFSHLMVYFTDTSNEVKYAHKNGLGEWYGPWSTGKYSQYKPHWTPWLGAAWDYVEDGSLFIKELYDDNFTAVFLNSDGDPYYCGSSVPTNGGPDCWSVEEDIPLPSEYNGEHSVEISTIYLSHTHQMCQYVTYLMNEPYFCDPYEQGYGIWACSTQVYERCVSFSGNPSPSYQPYGEFSEWEVVGEVSSLRSLTFNNLAVPAVMYETYPDGVHHKTIYKSRQSQWNEMEHFVNTETF